MSGELLSRLQCFSFTESSFILRSFLQRTEKRLKSPSPKMTGRVKVSAVCH